MQKQTPVDEAVKLAKLGMNEHQVIQKLSEEGFSPVQINDALTQSRLKLQIEGQQIKPSGEMPMQQQQSFMPSTLPTQQPAMPAQQLQQPQQPRSLKELSLPPPPQEPKEQEIPVPKPQAIAPTPAPPKQQMPKQPYQREEQAYPYAYPTYEEERVQPRVGTEQIEELAEEIVNEKWQEVKGKISDVIEWKTYAERRINSIDERIKRIETNIDRLQAALLSKVNEYGSGIKNLGAEMTSIETTLGKVLSPLIDNVRELSKITEDLKKSSPASPKKKAPPKRRR